MTHTLLSCPACSAQYNIPSAAIAPTGRRVKCTACGYSWQAFPTAISLADTISEPADMAVVTSENFDAPIDKESTPQESAALLAQALSRQGITLEEPVNQTLGLKNWFKAGTVTLITVAIIMGSMALLLRSSAGLELVQSYPSLTPALQLLGVHVPALGEGLVFENVTVARKTDNTSLVVAGQWRNRSAAGVTVPHMQAAILANPTDTAPLKTWPIRQTPRVIPSQGVAQFQYELADAPANGAHIKLNFVDKIQ